MGYKVFDDKMSFAEMELRETLEKTRSVQMMKRINRIINWKNIEALLIEHYKPGKSKAGADAYSPLLLLKCLLLQKWFRIE